MNHVDRECYWCRQQQRHFGHSTFFEFRQQHQRQKKWIQTHKYDCDYRLALAKIMTEEGKYDFEKKKSLDLLERSADGQFFVYYAY